ncbi:MAG: ribonuclease H [Acidimicrobiia bacterium]|nr:ribonuclease H [Acidimicrobiia bacterium]
MPDFTCRDCGAPFSLPQRVLDRYPGWVPRQCQKCRATSAPNRNPRAPRVGSENSPANGGDGPATGVFTDGSSVPNPGPGGWGAVYVVDDEIVAEDCGHEAETTNNRMELTALIKALDLIPEGTATTVYSDSHLAVRTITEWAEGWEKRGWKRKSGPVENLDLVKQAYAGYRSRPELQLEWIKAHVGYRWNEYADQLANRWRES